MINYFYKSKKDLGVNKIEKFVPGSWIYMESPNDLEINKLVKKFKLDEGLLRDALDPFEVPRVEKENRETYFSILFTPRSFFDL